MKNDAPALRFAAPPRPRQWRAWPAWVRDTPGATRLPLRLFLGVTFVVAALQKLANPAFFRASNPAGIQGQMRSAESFSPIGGLLGPAVHVAAALGVVIALGELAVGIGTLLGFRARIAAGGGMVLSLLFFLTVSWSTTPYYYGADIVFFFAWTPFVISGAGAFSLDAWFAARPGGEAAAPPTAGALRGEGGRRRAGAGAGTSLSRRTALSKLSVTGALGVLVLAIGGAVAGIGRALAPAGKGTSSGLGGAGSGSGGSGGSGGGTGSGSGGGSGNSGASGGSGGNSSGGSQPSHPKGRKIGLASQVPVGQAAPFVFDGNPAYVVRPKSDQFLGFSRVCTHEGCTVNYVGSVQQFQCPCHGSVYSAITGDVLSGPAPLPLPKIPIQEGPGGELFAD